MVKSILDALLSANLSKEPFMIMAIFAGNFKLLQPENDLISVAVSNWIEWIPFLDCHENRNPECKSLARSSWCKSYDIFSCATKPAQ
jgi:hypothetical protein